MDDNSPSPRAWLIVALLWVVACLNYLDRLMITTMRASVVETIPMTEAQFGLLTGVFLLVYGLLSPFAGFLADRFGRSRVVIGSLFVWSAITWLTAHAQTFEQLLAARALMGISEAFYLPAALALIADYHRGTTRSLATGIHMTGIYVGAGLGGIGGVIADQYEWTAAFTCFGLFGVGYSVILLLLLRDLPARQDSEMHNADVPRVDGFGVAIASLFSSGSFILVAIYWGLLGIGGWAFAGWLPTYLQEQFQLTQGTAGITATAYFQIAALFGVIAGGIWADRWSRRNPRGPILVPAVGLCLAAPGVLLAANADAIPFVILGVIVFGFTKAFTDANMMPILCLVADPRYRATGYGVLNLFACIVGGATIYAGGVLRDLKVDVSYIFQFAALSLVVCAILLFFLHPTQNAT